MTTTFIGLLKKFWRPQQSSIRQKFNSKRNTPPHFERAKVEELCKPYYPKIRDPSTPLYELCKGPGYPPAIENPFQIHLAQDAFNWIKKHKCLFFYHLNPMDRIELLETKLMLKKCGIRVRHYGRTTMEYAVKGTMYEPILVLFQSHTLIGCGNEVKLDEMMKNLKKTKINLLAGVVDDQFLSTTDLKNYCLLSDIQTARASFVSILQSVTSKIVQQLNQHPQTLFQHLEQHTKQLRGETS